MAPLALSVVVPCYNEEQVLGELYRRLSNACRLESDNYEIVLVNDGSRDNTWAVMQSLANADEHIVIVSLSRNSGHQLALSAGLTVCRGDRILIIDADLQDPPEMLGPMMRALDDGADVAYGRRRERAGELWFKRLTASLFYRLIARLSETPIPTDTGDFRLITRRLLDVLLTMPERHRFIRGMVSWIGFKQVAIEYDREPRFGGESKYPLMKMVRFACDAIVSFSTKPLILAAWLGFFASLMSVAIIVYTIVSWLFFATVPGWTSLIGAVALIGGIQLMVLGIFGAYLGRLYEQCQARPLFVIDSIVRGQNNLHTPGLRPKSGT